MSDRGIDPLTFCVDMGAHADGLDDGGGCESDPFGTLDEIVKAGTEVTVADIHKAQGMGVTVNGCAVVNLVVFGDAGRAVPVNESLLDFEAVRVMANAALTGVAARVNRGRLKSLEFGGYPVRYGVWGWRRGLG